MLGIAATQQGAMQAAHAIIDAGPRSGAEDLTFFRQKAEQLLWPLLFVAANDAERSMADVVRWLMTQDRPGDSGEGQVIAALDRLFVTGTAECRSEARAAYETLLGRWSIDDRTRSNIYATAQAVLAPWQDPGVIDAGQHTDVDLEWLLDRTPTAGGRAWSNTLYVCAPMQDQQRLAPVFGGLLGDLLNQAYGQANRSGEPIRDLLLVMDEAGNTAARWIPEIADTCAGIGVLLVTVWQSKAQIEQGYPTLADSVVTNPAPRSSSAACPMSRPSGTRRNSSATKRFTQTSRANDASTAANRRTVTESVIRTPLVPGYLLRRIPPGEALLVHGTLPPAHLRSRPWYDDDRLRRLAAYGTSQRTAREERHRRR